MARMCTAIPCMMRVPVAGTDRDNRRHAVTGMRRWEFIDGRTVYRILAATPAENPILVNQRAFQVAISRARDTAQLVTGW